MLKAMAVVLTAGVIIAASPGDIVINEIMYNSPGDDEEWAELFNNTDSDIILDTAWTISDGEGMYRFDGIVIHSSEYLTVEIYSSGAFPFTPDVDASGGDFQLSNGGDQVILMESDVLIDEVDYYDSWGDGRHDGDGPSLERINPLAPSNNPANWNSSVSDGGTPGAENSIYSPSTDLPPYISDLSYSPPLPTSSTVVSVTASIVDDHSVDVATLVYENIVAGPGVTHPISMFDDGAHGDGAAGDNIYGTSIPSQSDGSVVQLFVVAEDNIGQVDTSEALSYSVSDSGGGPEAVVVINEFMYNSPGQDTEYVELYNRSTSPVDMSDWRLKDGSSYYFTFPAGTEIPANGYLVVCKDTAEIATKYGIANIIGNFSFSLNNDDDSLTLWDDVGRVKDRLYYTDSDPWDSGADGDGPSLELIDPNLDNSDPTNWRASTVFYGTPGTANSVLSISAKSLPIGIAVSAFPNPFNGKCTISFYVSHSAHFRLDIINIQGHRVATPLDDHLTAGIHSVLIESGDLPSGLYLYRLESNAGSSEGNLLLIR